MWDWNSQPARAILVLLAAAVAAGLVGWLSGFVVRQLARARYPVLLTHLNRSCHNAWSALLLVVALLAALPSSRLHGDVRYGIKEALLVALIASTAWLTVKVLYVVEEATFRRLPLDVANNRRVRRRRTQIAMVRRLTGVAVTVVAFGAGLLLFGPVRGVGASLLATTGVAAGVAGLAGHTTLGLVFSGLQLAFTDALRLDDVVVVENEWGRVEEIRLTSVIVRLWDERRLVLPTTYFTTTPFQNWTRHEARVVGSVILHLDYATPVEELRAAARRIIEESPLWDRRDWVLQVIDTTPCTMVVRVLASAWDGPTAWDLRCDIRERLLDYVRQSHPQSMPRARTELAEPAAITLSNGSGHLRPQHPLESRTW
jgi:small-conductance mechanosensitive channel